MRALLLMAVLVSPAWAESEYKEFLGAAGEINWSRGTVSAEGYGAAADGANAKVASLLACRAAIADGQRNLLEATEGVRIKSETLVKDFMLESDEIRTTVEGVVRGASIVDRETQDNGACRVIVRMSMAGKLTETVYKSAFEEKSAALQWQDVGRRLLDWWIPTAYAAEAASDTWTSAYEGLAQRLEAIEKKLNLIPASTLIRVADSMPTGLVVDSRGSNFIPSLSPNLRQIKGGVIYPNQQAQGAILGSGQMVALFARDVDFAIKHPKVGERPLVVKALRTWGKSRTEIVLSEDSASKLNELARTDFFANSGVIIVLD